MTLFTKPLNEITYDDVVAFCGEGYEESVNLDYKKDFPKDLEKSISAFANTSGGVIVIGVEEENNRPKAPFEGIDYVEKAEDRVWNINIGNVYPPVEISVKSLPNNDKSKMFVLIRIPESHEAPHAILNKTHTHIRTGNRTKPEELVNFDQLEWLLNKRKKSEELRELSLMRAEARFVTICRVRGVPSPNGELTLSFIPQYPRRPFCSVEDLDDIFNRIRIANKGGMVFPELSRQSEFIQGGTASYSIEKDHDYLFYTELNPLGLVFFKENLADYGTLPGIVEPEWYMRLIRLLARLDLALDFVSQLYSSLGFWGVFQTKISLRKLTGVRIIPTLPKNQFYHYARFHKNEIEPDFEWNLIKQVSSLNEPNIRQQIIIETVMEISRSFNYPQEAGHFKEQLQELGRWHA